MDESELESIWMTDILPIVGERMIPASHPITVFLGGQPAAGKTRAQRRLTGIYDGLLAPIIGDDFRRYHPDYERLLSEAPLDMPDATAKAAGYWTGRAVACADEKRASCIIEGTSSLRLFAMHPELKSQYWKRKGERSLWSPSYFAESIGSVNEQAVSKYIDDQ